MHEKTLVEAKKRLLRGELVIFPTETVYGIGSNAENEDAVKLIYQVKKRPFHNPLICHFADMSCLLYTSPSPRDATLSRMPSSA